MREIRYYDRINKQYVDLEVTDEVARFLMSSSKKIQRKQNLYNYYTISLNEVVYKGDGKDDDLTYKDIIAEPEEETMNCKTCKERLGFYNIIWNVVAKLDKEKYDLIWDIFVEKKKQKEIANELGKSEELISQLKDTAISDLIYHFNFDKAFRKTKFYKKYRKDNRNDLIRIAKEITPDEIGQYIMNGTHDFTKTLTQILKKSTILNKDIEVKDKISKVNRIVKQTTEKLNPDKEKDKQLNIPEDIFTKDVIDKAIDILNKFFK